MPLEDLKASVTRIKGASASAQAALAGAAAKVTEAVDRAMADANVTKEELATAVRAQAAEIDQEATALAAAVVANP